MKIGDFQGYEVHVPMTGGKAGKGRQVTSTIQVRRPFGADGFTVAKQFRFTLAEADSRQAAIRKAKQWMTDNPLPR